MKLKSQVAILKTVVKFQAQEIDALQDMVKALQKGPVWQRTGHTGFSWDWQCRECQATMFAGHNTDCIHSEYVQPRGLVGGVVERPPLEFPPEYYEDEKERPNVLTGSIQGDTETITMTWPPKWEAMAWEEVTFDSGRSEKAGRATGGMDGIVDERNAD